LGPGYEFRRIISADYIIIFIETRNVETRSGFTFVPDVVGFTILSIKIALERVLINGTVSSSSRP